MRSHLHAHTYTHAACSDRIAPTQPKHRHAERQTAKRGDGGGLREEKENKRSQRKSDTVRGSREQTGRVSDGRTRGWSIEAQSERKSRK